MRYNEISNTNLEKVFLLNLESAISNNLPQSELPDKIHIISDMKFDAQYNTNGTIFQIMKDIYQKHRYKLPTIVYWNVNGRNNNFPTRNNETGAVLVSGSSPVLFNTIINSYSKPEEYMRSILDQERYCNITA